MYSGASTWNSLPCDVKAAISAKVATWNGVNWEIDTNYIFVKQNKKFSEMFYS